MVEFSFTQVSGRAYVYAALGRAVSQVGRAGPSSGEMTPLPVPVPANTSTGQCTELSTAHPECRSRRSGYSSPATRPCV
jgi:hypothetical protein